MHVLSLNGKTAVGKHQLGFLSDVEVLPCQGRIYRTYGGCADGPAITFTTTSKDIHLFMGKLSREGIRALSELLDDVMNPGGIPKHREILFSFPDTNGSMKLVYVICSCEVEGDLIMNLSATR